LGAIWGLVVFFAFEVEERKLDKEIKAQDVQRAALALSQDTLLAKTRESAERTALAQGKLTLQLADQTFSANVKSAALDVKLKELDQNIKNGQYNLASTGRISSKDTININFGEIPGLYNVSYALKLTNTSDADMEVTWVSLSFFLGKNLIAESRSQAHGVSEKLNIVNSPTRLLDDRMLYQELPGALNNAVAWKWLGDIAYVDETSKYPNAISQFYAARHGGPTGLLHKDISNNSTTALIVSAKPGSWVGVETQIGLDGSTGGENLWTRHRYSSFPQCDSPTSQQLTHLESK
jgi:hypothetical protein